MSDGQNGIYTEEENEILTKSKNIRLRMVDAIFDENGGKVTHGGTVRVVNEVLTSLDKTVNDAAVGRLKHQDNSNKAAILQTVAETLKRVSSNKSNLPATDLTIDAELENVATVAGEISVQPEKLMIEDFVDTKKGS